MFCSNCGGELDGTGTCPSDCLADDYPGSGTYCPSCGGKLNGPQRKGCDNPGYYHGSFQTDPWDAEWKGVPGVDPGVPDPELEKLLAEEEERG